jgi:hypothetical protein
MVLMAGNAVDDVDGALLITRFALHDRDTIFVMQDNPATTDYSGTAIRCHFEV